MKNKIEENRLVFLRLIKISITFLVVFFLFIQLTNYNFNLLVNRITLGISEYTNPQAEGSVGIRKEMIAIKVLKSLEENPILGRGWNFTFIKGVNTESHDYFLIYFDPYALNGDSTWPNLFILFGLLGFILYLLFLISYYINSINIAKKIKGSELYPLSISLIPIPIFIFLHSFSSSYFNTTGLIFIVVFSVILYDLKKSYMHFLAK